MRHFLALAYAPKSPSGIKKEMCSHANQKQLVKIQTCSWGLKNAYHDKLKNKKFIFRRPKVFFTANDRLEYLPNSSQVLVHFPLCNTQFKSPNRTSLTAGLEVLWNLVELLYFFGTVLAIAGALPLLTGPQTLLHHLHNLLVHFAKRQRQRHRVILTFLLR